MIIRKRFKGPDGDIIKDEDLGPARVGHVQGAKANTLADAVPVDRKKLISPEKLKRLAQQKPKSFYGPIK